MTTNNITVYDPAMCCATGVCGPEVDPKLARFSADLDWLAAQGVAVRRFNLAQELGAFAEDASAKSALETNGEAALPLIKAGDAVVSSARTLRATSLRRGPGSPPRRALTPKPSRARIMARHAKRLLVVPWSADEPTGVVALRRLMASTSGALAGRGAEPMTRSEHAFERTQRHE